MLCRKAQNYLCLQLSCFQVFFLDLQFFQIFCSTCLEVITEWLRLEGTSGDRLVQPPSQSHLEQVAQGPVRRLLSAFKDGGATASPGNLSRFNHPHSTGWRDWRGEGRKENTICLPSDRITCVSVCAHSISSFCWAPLRRVWLCLLDYSFPSIIYTN